MARTLKKVQLEYRFAIVGMQYTNYWQAEKLRATWWEENNMIQDPTIPFDLVFTGTKEYPERISVYLDAANTTQKTPAEVIGTVSDATLDEANRLMDDYDLLVRKGYATDIDGSLKDLFTVAIRDEKVDDDIPHWVEVVVEGEVEVDGRIAARLAER